MHEAQLQSYRGAHADSATRHARRRPAWRRHPGRSAFSLLELVIVLAIIGTLTAIAIPGASRAVSHARCAALKKSLASIRSATDRYSAEHGGALPGADNNGVTFWRQLRRKTDADGNVGSTPGVHDLGPYLSARVEVPVGPNAGASGIHFSLTSPPSIDESLQMRGWAYNNQSGELVANTDDEDGAGVPYNTY